MLYRGNEVLPMTYFSSASNSGRNRLQISLMSAMFMLSDLTIIGTLSSLYSTLKGEISVVFSSLGSHGGRNLAQIGEEGQDAMRYSPSIKAIVSTEKFLWAMFDELIRYPEAQEADFGIRGE